ncbi:MAG: prolyl-tRNA synthetase associated domain-containing protein [Bacteroidetes bacterium]|nr:prolyl-tRNA synthetase associated domain-containing protein [Bacteroidota bacterium]
MLFEKRKRVFDVLASLGIEYEVFEHPPLNTIEMALEYWKDIEATHCKNLFFRNHKGNQHYLVIIKDTTPFNVTSLEKKLRQGKLTFGSEKRLIKYLDVLPGSVSPFGLINDTAKHVIVFLDEQLRNSQKISFHPNDNTASLVLSFSDFIKYLNHQGNFYSYIDPSPKND